MTPDLILPTLATLAVSTRTNRSIQRTEAALREIKRLREQP